jgi:hypothetical protein
MREMTAQLHNASTVSVEERNIGPMIREHCYVASSEEDGEAIAARMPKTFGISVCGSRRSNFVAEDRYLHRLAMPHCEIKRVPRIARDISNQDF